jgi:hypothetical protein
MNNTNLSEEIRQRNKKVILRGDSGMSFFNQTDFEFVADSDAEEEKKEDVTPATAKEEPDSGFEDLTSKKSNPVEEGLEDIGDFGEIEDGANEIESQPEPQEDAYDFAELGEDGVEEQKPVEEEFDFGDDFGGDFDDIDAKKTEPVEEL